MCTKELLLFLQLHLVFFANGQLIPEGILSKFLQEPNTFKDVSLHRGNEGVLYVLEPVNVDSKIPYTSVVNYHYPSGNEAGYVRYSCVGITCKIPFPVKWHSSLRDIEWKGNKNDWMTLFEKHFIITSIDSAIQTDFFQINDTLFFNQVKGLQINSTLHKWSIESLVEVNPLTFEIEKVNQNKGNGILFSWLEDRWVIYRWNEKTFTIHQLGSGTKLTNEFFTLKF